MKAGIPYWNSHKLADKAERNPKNLKQIAEFISALNAKR